MMLLPKFYKWDTVTLFEQSIRYNFFNVDIKLWQNCQEGIAFLTSNLLRPKVIIFPVSFASKAKSV